MNDAYVDILLKHAFSVSARIIMGVFLIVASSLSGYVLFQYKQKKDMQSKKMLFGAFLILIGTMVLFMQKFFQSYWVENKCVFMAMKIIATGIIIVGGCFYIKNNKCGRVQENVYSKAENEQVKGQKNSKL